MAFQSSLAPFLQLPFRRSRLFLVGLLASTLTAGLGSLIALPALAGDPFRPNNPHAIGEATEAAFKAAFYEGDYPAAAALVRQAIAAEPGEPMNYAMAAAFDYLNRDYEQVARQAERTKATAAALKETDPLRSHLYTAVGIFVEGAYILQTQGIARGTPTVLRMLQQVFSELDAAEKINPTDPELSLLKGFMDLLLAVSLPFANADQAIARLENGYPAYLSYRGIAIGLRDLKRYEEAIVAVDRALAAAPNNPDLIYLKAQILFLKQDFDASLPLYASALTYADQLPGSVVRQIRFEECLAQGKDGPTCAEISNINAG